MTYRMWTTGALGGMGGYWATPGQWQRRLWDEEAQMAAASSGAVCGMVRPMQHLMAALRGRRR